MIKTVPLVFESMNITAVFNHFFWLIDDKNDSFCQDADEHVGTILEETLKKRLINRLLKKSAAIFVQN